jgi:hypothetical protein
VAEIKIFHQTVEALQLHSNAQLLVLRVNHMLPAQEGSSSRPGDAPTLTMELGSLVSNVSLHGDPDVILLLAWSPFSGCFTRLHANNVNSPCDHTSQALPGFILLLAGPPPPSSTVTGKSPSHVAGGGSPVEVLQLHSNTRSYWSSGSTICLGAVVHILGMNPYLLWNCVLLLEMSRKTTETYWEINVDN